MRLRNVLTLITALVLDPRGVDSVDPYGMRGVFMGCPCGVQHSTCPCDVDEHDDKWAAYRSQWS